MFIKKLYKFQGFQQARRVVVAAANSSMSKYNVVFVLGGPGAGKGTQCQKIVQEFGFTHLSAGDLLRAEQANSESQYGSLIDKYIKDGQIVPVKITCSLLERAMQETCKIDGSKNNFLIDGFPRNQDNYQGWNEEMSAKTNVKFVLFFDCNEETCVQRCLSRGQGRTDDNEQSLKKRFRTYYECTKPIIDLFEEQKMVRKIDATRTVDQVFEDVKSLF